jgi:hypothetical protein
MNLAIAKASSNLDVCDEMAVCGTQDVQSLDGANDTTPGVPQWLPRETKRMECEDHEEGRVDVEEECMLR